MCTEYAVVNMSASLNLYKAECINSSNMYYEKKISWEYG